METPRDGFIMSALLVIVAIILVGGGAYLYTTRQPSQSTQNQQQNSNKTVAKQSTQQNSSSTAQRQNETSNFGKLLPHGYQPQTSYETDLLNQLQKRLRSDYAGGAYLNVVPALRYYDDKTVLYEFPTAKSYNLEIANVNTLYGRNTYDDMHMQTGNYIQDDTYIVAIEPVLIYPGAEPTGEEQLVVYKKGADDFYPIEGSTLDSSETYAQQDADFYTGSLIEGVIDGAKEAVSVSVFKDNPDAPRNEKARIATYPLP